MRGKHTVALGIPVLGGDAAPLGQIEVVRNPRDSAFPGPLGGFFDQLLPHGGGGQASNHTSGKRVQLAHAFPFSMEARGEAGPQGLVSAKKSSARTSFGRLLLQLEAKFLKFGQCRRLETEYMLHEHQDALGLWMVT